MNNIPPEIEGHIKLLEMLLTNTHDPVKVAHYRIKFERMSDEELRRLEVEGGHVDDEYPFTRESCIDELARHEVYMDAKRNILRAQVEEAKRLRAEEAAKLKARAAELHRTATKDAIATTNDTETLRKLALDALEMAQCYKKLIAFTGH